MTEPKNSFVLYLDQLKHINKLSDEQAGKLIKGIYQYETYNETPCFDDPLVDIVFGFISDQLERDRIKYEEKCSQNRENGSKGGRPRKANGFQENPQKANGFQEKPKKADNDTDNDTENDSDNDADHGNESDKCIAPQAEPLLETDKPKRQSRFIPPTVETVRQYIAEIGSTIDAESFVDYYTANGWKAGRNAMKDWKAAVRNWTRRNIESKTTAIPKKESKMDILKRMYKEALDDENGNNSNNNSN